MYGMDEYLSPDSSGYRLKRFSNICAQQVNGCFRCSVSDTILVIPDKPVIYDIYTINLICQTLYTLWQVNNNIAVCHYVVLAESNLTDRKRVLPRFIVD